MLNKEVHLYKYVQSHIIILQHVTYVTVSYKKNTILIK